MSTNHIEEDYCCCCSHIHSSHKLKAWSRGKLLKFQSEKENMFYSTVVAECLLSVRLGRWGLLTIPSTVLVAGGDVYGGCNEAVWEGSLAPTGVPEKKVYIYIYIYIYIY